MSRMLTILVCFILMIGIVSAFMGCLGEDKSDLKMNILDAEVRDKDDSGHGAAQGNVFLYMQVLLKNRADDSELYPVPGNFELDTDQGYTHSYHDEIGFPDKLEPGNESEFWISFEISEEEIGEILRYEPDWPQKDTFEEEVPSYEGNTQSGSFFIQPQKIQVDLSSGHYGGVNRKVRTISKS